jgi:diacylglycerol kinase (ATP)
MPASRDRSERGNARPVGARLRSFQYAFEGLRYVLGQPNFRIHLAAAALVIVAAALLRVSSGEWLALILVSLLVLIVEMLNTVIEVVVDLVSPDRHPLAKIAKDVGAGAVLTAAFAAAIVGVYVFGPRLLHVLGH